MSITPIRLSYLILVTLLLSCIFSCGGGTAGSSSTGSIDTRSRLIQGTVLTSEGAPVAGALVYVSDGNLQVTTDSMGEFEISAEVGTSFSVSLLDNGILYEVQVQEVEESASVVAVGITIDRNKGEAKADPVKGSVEISGICSQYGSVNGRNIKLALPDKNHSCDFQFSFKGKPSVLQPKNSVKIASSSCKKLKLSSYGSQLNGNELLYYLNIQIPRQAKRCSANLVSEFDNANKGPTFKLDLSTESGREVKD